MRRVHREHGRAQRPLRAALLDLKHVSHGSAVARVAGAAPSRPAEQRSSLRRSAAPSRAFHTCACQAGVPTAPRPQPVQTPLAKPPMPQHFILSAAPRQRPRQLHTGTPHSCRRYSDESAPRPPLTSGRAASRCGGTPEDLVTVLSERHVD
jgi:hypothetical protein